MERPDRRKIIAAALALLLIGAAVYAIVVMRQPSDKLNPGKTGSASENQTTEQGGETASGETSSAPLDITPAPNEVVPPSGHPGSHTTKPAVKPKPPTTPTSTPTPPADQKWLAYLAATGKIVVDNAPSLQVAATAAANGLKAQDSAVLTSMFAPGEPGQDAYIAALLNKYRSTQILSVKQLNTVNIFASNGVTAYMVYREVQWKDQGIESRHTIPFTMRFINGQWYLTSINDSTDGLQFVQTIRVLQ